MAVYSMMFMGMAPIGAILAGAVAHRFTAPIAVTLGGALAVIAGVIFWFRLPKLRAEARELITAQTVTPGQPVRDLPSPSAG